ncbi:MAG: YdeI family protein [Acholeplasmataceae bacterium]
MLLTTQLFEDRKWGQPCYTLDDKNIVIIGAFKNYVTLSFHKGTLMKDSYKVLVSPGENSRAVKFYKFTTVEEIKQAKPIILEYIDEAIEIEKKGMKIPPIKPNSEPYPDELKDMFKEMPEFEQAFESLTPGRRRAYLMFFNAAKQSQTKINRIEKYMDLIFEGKGMND